MPAPALTITGTLQDVFGVADPHSSLVVQLCNFGSQVPRVSGTSLLANTAPVNIDCPVGTFSFALYGNDVIIPAGTYYTIQVQDDNGNIVQTNAYQFAGAGSFDLSTIAPYNPPPPTIVTPNPVLLNPAGTQTINGNIIINGFLQVSGAFSFGGLVTVAFTATPIFNASSGASFEMTLTGNVTSSTIINTFAGEVVSFIIIQDGTGGRTFAWPANVINPGVIDATPNAINVQTFVARANGNLYPIGPMTVN